MISKPPASFSTWHSASPFVERKYVQTSAQHRHSYPLKTLWILPIQSVSWDYMLYDCISRPLDRYLVHDPRVLSTSFHIFPLARHCTDVFAAPPATVLGPVARWPLAFLARAGPSREAGAFRTHQYLWVKLNTSRLWYTTTSATIYAIERSQYKGKKCQKARTLTQKRDSVVHQHDIESNRII